jgi:hypothetical protein
VRAQCDFGIVVFADKGSDVGVERGEIAFDEGREGTVMILVKEEAVDWCITR